MGNSGSSRQEPSSSGKLPHQNKVLLDLDRRPRLRATQNGAILQGGGTISQKKLQRDLYGSEPDLRFSVERREEASKLRISRNNRKKYKAPQVPQHHEHFQDLGPSRRLRLFLTRAEAKRKTNEPVSLDSSLPPPGGRLRRSLSTPQFQQNQEELDRHYEPPRPPPPANGFLEELRQKQMLRESKFKSKNSIGAESRRREKESRRREEEPWPAESPVPVKTFYFGMDEPLDDPFGFDSFSPEPHAPSYTSTESRLSGSEDYDDTTGGIAVHLRATLPRKRIEIPRFSPAAAWRLLSTAETPTQSTTEEDEVVESRIQAPPPIQIPALLPDKSADSGISGDASPQQFDSAAWTPQQDLEETSSDGFPTDFLGDLRYTPRLALSAADRPPFPFTKPPFPDLDDNWRLSSSIPSSVNYPVGRTEDDPPASLVKKPSYSYLSAGGHVMYLPEYSDEHRERLSKSCEDLGEPAELRQAISDYRPKKFAFQSTIRQQERKALADRLSKIAEHTELKRHSEQEAMRRVEEEFQRKREREKADIRQQLRLYNITQAASLQSSASNP